MPDQPSSQTGASRIPVSVITGFLGSGKTTLINHILHGQHGRKIAVIENEFGEVSIDSQMVEMEGQEELIEFNNGCLCCTVRGDLIRTLDSLSKRAKSRRRVDRNHWAGRSGAGRFDVLHRGRDQVAVQR